MKIIIASGYYDPVTIGHIEYLKVSKIVKFISLIIFEVLDSFNTRGI